MSILLQLLGWLGLASSAQLPCTTENVWLVAPRIARGATASTLPVFTQASRGKWPPERRLIGVVDFANEGDVILLWCSVADAHAIRCTPLAIVQLDHNGVVESYSYDAVVIRDDVCDGVACARVALYGVSLVSTRTPRFG